jgi:hypothetical protein
VRKKTLTSGLSMLAIVGTLVGCSGTGAGNPASATATPQSPVSSATSGGSQGGGDLPSDGAPRVGNPLDPSAFVQAPCQMLTSTQVTELLGSAVPGTPGQGAVAQSCDWRNRESGAHVTAQFETSTKRGLSAAYAARKSYALWEEYPSIAGYPGVAYGPSDTRQDGNCTIAVGVSDQLSFDISLFLSTAKRGQKDPCEVARVAAERAVQTMKSGGS